MDLTGDPDGRTGVAWIDLYRALRHHCRAGRAGARDPGGDSIWTCRFGLRAGGAIIRRRITCWGRGAAPLGQCEHRISCPSGCSRPVTGIPVIAYGNDRQFAAPVPGAGAKRAGAGPDARPIRRGWRTGRGWCRRWPGDLRRRTQAELMSPALEKAGVPAGRSMTWPRLGRSAGRGAGLAHRARKALPGCAVRCGCAQPVGDRRGGARA